MSGDITDWYNFKIDGNGNFISFANPRFENPQDSNQDNIYKFNITAKDNAGNTSIQPIAITIKDEFEADKVAPIVTVVNMSNAPTLGTLELLAESQFGDQSI